MISFIMLNVQRVKAQKTTLKKQYEGCQKKYKISSKLTKNVILYFKRKNIGKLIYKEKKKKKIYKQKNQIKELTRLIISAAFYGDRDIKMSHYIFRTIVENIFVSCFISGSKPCDSVAFL